MNKKTEYDKENGFVVKYNTKGRPYVGFPVSNFPKNQFDKWNESCMSDFANCRWAKMMSDHEKAKMYDILLAQEEANEDEQIVVEEQKKEDEDDIPLIGRKDEVKEDVK